MAVRSVLIVAFAIVFISLLSAVFGSDNAPLAVALFCIMLGIRFVNFEYCIRDSLLTLAVTLAILVLGPSAASVLPPVFLIPLHYICFFSLLAITTQRPEMGNGGLYSFAYVYLTGNPVTGEALIRRSLLAVTGYLLCAAILYAKHHQQHKTVRFRHVVQQFDLSNAVCLWQLRMALGVSLVLTAGQLFGMKRFMWMGFACASLLSEYPYSGNSHVLGLEEKKLRIGCHVVTLVGENQFAALYLVRVLSIVKSFFQGLSDGFTLADFVLLEIGFDRRPPPSKYNK